jgi:natural resistance-associated macrophage protein
MQEIIGSAIAFQVLFGLPLWGGCLITLVDTLTFLGIHYFGVRKLEAVFVLLVSL